MQGGLIKVSYKEEDRYGRVSAQEVTKYGRDTSLVPVMNQILIFSLLEWLEVAVEKGLNFEFEMNKAE